jgi:Astacin (Peptidase family M12A)
MPKEEMDTFNLPYDYGSVLHYSPYAFSSNGRPTIEPKDGKDETRNKFGQRLNLSQLDIEKIKKMYCV